MFVCLRARRSGAFSFFWPLVVVPARDTNHDGRGGGYLRPAGEGASALRDLPPCRYTSKDRTSRQDRAHSPSHLICPEPCGPARPRADRQRASNRVRRARATAQAVLPQLRALVNLLLRTLRLLRLGSRAEGTAHTSTKAPLGLEDLPRQSCQANLAQARQRRPY